MADPPPPSGEWLPPQAPGGRPPPRFEPEPEPQFAPPVAPPPAAPRQPEAPPVFVKPQTGPVSGLTIAALILSISSLLFLVLSLGLSFALSLPLSAAAWVCAARKKSAIRAGRAEGGARHAQLGLVLAMVGVALSVAAMVVWIGLIAAGFSLEELQRNLEQELERQRQRQRSSDDPVTHLRELSAAAAVLLGR
ncbi:MAG TPA: hypothetical protein VES79_04650 [Solirubrobacteraceae bacterium]|nr:hypothetical protein [Solirubrobacteraceae bacterium]